MSGAERRGKKRGRRVGNRRSVVYVFLAIEECEEWEEWEDGEDGEDRGGRKQGRREAGKEGNREARKEGRTEGGKKGRKEGRTFRFDIDWHHALGTSDIQHAAPEGDGNETTRNKV